MQRKQLERARQDVRMMGKGTEVDGEKHGRPWGKARLFLGKGTEVHGEKHVGLWISGSITGSATNFMMGKGTVVFEWEGLEGLQWGVVDPGIAPDH